MSKQALKLIEQAVRDAKEQGVVVHRGNGAIFDWTGPDRTLPKAVDVTGAVLMAMGRANSTWVYKGKTIFYGKGEPRGGWSELTEYLGVNTWWWWRFFRGWSYSQQIEVAELNKDGNIIGWKEDDVSKTAIRMAKKFTTKTDR